VFIHKGPIKLDMPRLEHQKWHLFADLMPPGWVVLPVTGNVSSSSNGSSGSIGSIGSVPPPGPGTEIICARASGSGMKIIKGFVALPKLAPQSPAPGAIETSPSLSNQVAVDSPNQPPSVTSSNMTTRSPASSSSSAEMPYVFCFYIIAIEEWSSKMVLQGSSPSTLVNELEHGFQLGESTLFYSLDAATRYASVLMNQGKVHAFNSEPGSLGSIGSDSDESCTDSKFLVVRVEFTAEAWATMLRDGNVYQPLQQDNIPVTPCCGMLMPVPTASSTNIRVSLAHIRPTWAIQSRCLMAETIHKFAVDALNLKKQAILRAIIKVQAELTVLIAERRQVDNALKVFKSGNS